MRPFDYASPRALDEALDLLNREGYGAAVPLAGGTDLLTLMKADLTAPERLIDIKRLPDLTGVWYDDLGGLRLGGLTTLAEIETNEAIGRAYPLLAEAAAVAATPQLRNMATIGGNLLQRPRCWYFRNPRFHCWLRGGDTCNARDGENQLHALLGDGPCYAAHPSDLAPALLAMDAEVNLRDSNRERTLPLAGLFHLPAPSRRVETVLRPGELITAIRAPSLPEDAHGTYLKAMDRNAWSFALVSVAAVIGLNRGRVEHARLVLGGVAPIPWRANTAEEVLLGAYLDDEMIARAAEAALAGARPLAGNGYKVPLARTLIRRALTSVLSR